MKIALFGRTISPVFFPSLKRLLDILHLHHVEVIVFEPFCFYLKEEVGIDAAKRATSNWL